jgi:ornithine cyclodeaminase/alanine dehydrogenase-like protein (mu-crystallin family)
VIAASALVVDHLADVVTSRGCGRRSADEVVVFDSTGTALQEVAASMDEMSAM